MNSACVNTLDFRSPTGKPLAETTPSEGDRLFFGWGEKKSDPSDNGETLFHSGVGRASYGGGEVSGETVSSCDSATRCGRESTYSYISRNRSKSVGKKMSK